MQNFRAAVIVNGSEAYLKFSGDMFPEYIELFEDFA